MQSVEMVAKSIHKIALEDPKEKAKKHLISDYGDSINQYLIQLSELNSLSANHLCNHKIQGAYRAKMVDWMVEVLTAFKCCDQTFFVAISLMDRYFDALNKNNQRCLELSELHITGIACMFIASKYEDVYPLLMRTIFNKIGHKKISEEAIRERELDILMAIGFKIGSLPTQLEFIDKYIEEILCKHKDKAFIHLMAVYLAKMSTHHEKLCVKQPNLAASSSIYVALKICEQMR